MARPPLCCILNKESGGQACYGVRYAPSSRPSRSSASPPHGCHPPTCFAISPLPKTEMLKHVQHDNPLPQERQLLIKKAALHRVALHFTKIRILISSHHPDR